MSTFDLFGQQLRERAGQARATANLAQAVYDATVARAQADLLAAQRVANELELQVREFERVSESPATSSPPVSSLIPPEETKATPEAPVEQKEKTPKEPRKASAKVASSLEVDAEAPYGRKANGEPKKKPGPAKKGDAAAEVAPVKTSPPREPKPAPTSAQNSVAHIVEVLGQDSLSLDDILARLKTKKWTPNTGDPKGYLRYLLNRNGNPFERESRGQYRVKRDTEAKASLAKPPVVKFEAPEVDRSDVDRVLLDAGIQIDQPGKASNPFDPLLGASHEGHRCRSANA